MRESIMPCYAPSDILFCDGEGCYLIDEKGERYLDFTSGIAVNALGHKHPGLIKTLQEAAGNLWHLSNVFRIRSAEILADKLVAHTFADRVFFANSGAEANECGLKAIRRYQYDNHHPERYRIIAMGHSFHGRTLGTIACAGNPDYTKGFIPHDYGFDQVAFGDIEALKVAITPNTAGIILEPIQGEGGIKVADPKYLQAIRALCDEKDLVLMFDEVQCGIGRTGTLYAYEQLGVIPDILTTAKGIGGGFPIGACLTTERIGQHMTVGTHGSTFGGNALATTIGNFMIDTITNPAFLDHVQKISHYLIDKLGQLIKRHPHIYRQVSGLGLMLGLSLNVPNQEILNHLRDDEHILVVKAGGNSIRLLPALIIEHRHIDALIAGLDRIAHHYETL